MKKHSLIVEIACFSVMLDRLLLKKASCSFIVRCYTGSNCNGSFKLWSFLKTCFNGHIIN